MTADPPAVIELGPVIETEAEFRQSVRVEFAFVKDQQRDIKTVLDLLLKFAQVED